MARPVDKHGNTWDLYIDRSKTYKYPYVKAKRSAWDAEKHQARIIERQHGGRLFPNGSVKLGKSFLERFPQFAGETFYYCDNELYTFEEYQAIAGGEDKGAAPEADSFFAVPFFQGGFAAWAVDPLPEEAPEKNFAVEVGVSWAAWETLEKAGVVQDLQEAFGEERGLNLARLAVFAFEEGAAWDLFGEWTERTGLPGLSPMSKKAIRRILEGVSEEELLAFWRGRVARSKALARQRRPGSPVASLLPLVSVFECVSGVAPRTGAWQGVYGSGALGVGESEAARFAAVCDSVTGEVLCAVDFCGQEGGERIAGLMQAAGLQAEDALLVRSGRFGGLGATPGFSCWNFLEALPEDDPEGRAALRENKEVLESAAGFDAKTLCWSATARAADSSGDWLHLFVDSDAKMDEIQSLAREIEEERKTRNGGARSGSCQKGGVRRFLKLRRDEERDELGTGGEEGGPWVRDNAAFSAAVEFSGRLAIRSNCIASGACAFQFCRDRRALELASDAFDARELGDAPARLVPGLEGRLLVKSLALTIRMAMRLAARRTREAASFEDVERSRQPLQELLARLNGVLATRMGNSTVWRLVPLTKKQREAFALLEVASPRERVELL